MILIEKEQKKHDDDINISNIILQSYRVIKVKIPISSITYHLHGNTMVI